MTLVDGVPTPRTVKWVGHRDLDLSRHPKREYVAPIRITQGALGDNLPRRDMIVSPDHCLFIDGGLYPAKLLVNDMTIVRDLTATAVSYHHIELDQHAVMIAEGVPAESYLDTGNRSFFSNAGLATILHPELNINENLRCWETDACAPLTVQPELVQPVWQRFADRAVAQGYTAPVYETTRDAGIHLVVDGKIVRPLAAEGKTVTFMVPGKAELRAVGLSCDPPERADPLAGRPAHSRRGDPLGDLARSVRRIGDERRPSLAAEWLARAGIHGGRHILALERR